MYKLKAKYAPMILVPHNGIDVRADKVETQDGVIAGIKFVATWNDNDGRYYDEIDEICKDKFDTPLAFIRSLWFARLGDVGNTWHLIELIKE